MAGGEDLINFDLIENQKENIQALPSGRSAKALATVFSPLAARPSPLSQTQDANSGVRAEFEKELQLIDESDDPLDIYDRYVKWTLDTYPSAQATTQSQLLPLLERATKAFVTSSHYKNDPRYLRIWLHYIRFFSDSPRETFVYLARNAVGEGLALYYEEFAAWLENAGRWNQAEEVYKMGIEREARPAERLLRKFGEFEKRKQAKASVPDEPSSPALPTTRPALAPRMDPYSISSPSAGAAQAAVQQQGAATKKSKLTIFADDSAEPRPGSGGSTRGWEAIGTLAERKKENTIAAKPWAGETLKSSAPRPQGVPKMAIFKDQSKQGRISKTTAASRAHQVLNPKTGRIERVVVNLDTIYPNPKNLKEEYCFEELCAARRGWLQRDWRSTTLEQAANEQTVQLSVPVKFDDSPTKKPVSESTVDITGTITRQLLLNDENDENGNAKSAKKPRDDVARRLRREEKANRTRKVKVREVKQETQTVQTNLNSPSGPKLKKKKRTVDPTMTMVSKAALSDIYDIFNQPINRADKEPEAEASESESESEDEEEEEEDVYVSDAESTATGKLSVSMSEFGDETRRDLGLDEDDGNSDMDEEDATNNTAWSEFDTKRDIPSDIHADDDTTRNSNAFSEATGTNVTSLSATHDDEEDEEDTPEQSDEAQPATEAHDEVTTPTSPTPGFQEIKKTTYVPVQPEDYEPLTRVNPYRDPNSRLPFMTPIVEKTESSLGTVTQRHDGGGEFFGSKTPCPRKTPVIPELDDEENEIWSSPIRAQLDQPKLSLEKSLLDEPTSEQTLSQPSILAPITNESRSRPRPQPRSKDTPVTKGPIIHDLQVNPMDPAVHATILNSMHPPLSTFDGYHAHPSALNRRKDLQKFTKAQKARPSADPSPTLTLGPSSFVIRKELGAGAFAPVYLASSSGGTVAIKTEDPPSAWEFYMIRTAHRRLGVSRVASSLVSAHALHLFADEGYLVEEHREHGTLLDLVNALRESPSAGIDEALAMFFAVELLRTIEGLHGKGVIHGDLKADNALVRLPCEEGSDLSPKYSPSGAGGWSDRGITLIDFGRGIDMTRFAPAVGFVADWPTGPTDCAEMRELRPWTYQADYHGVAAIAHTLLFGRYIDTVADKGNGIAAGAKSWRVREPLKRYWATELWGEFFGALLNPSRFVDREEGARMPIQRTLRGVREGMEAWLVENGERGVGLRGWVRRAEERLRR